MTGAEPPRASEIIKRISPEQDFQYFLPQISEEITGILLNPFGPVLRDSLQVHEFTSPDYLNKSKTYVNLYGDHYDQR